MIRLSKSNRWASSSSLSIFLTVVLLWTTEQTTAFVPTTTDGSTISNSCLLRNRLIPTHQIFDRTYQKRTTVGSENNDKKLKTRLYFMGSDGGILGIGTPELFTILLVGYYVLGPSDLFKLTKEIGKFVQNFQTFASEATTTFETNMESQLQLEEIRKAQRELNDAFSFRRSINVDDDSDPFSVTNQSPRIGEDITDNSLSKQAAEREDVTASEKGVDPSKKKKKRIRRIKKKKAPIVDGDDVTVTTASMEDDPKLANDIPSTLDMTDIDDEYARAEKRMMESISNGVDVNDSVGLNAAADDDAAQARKARLERLERGMSNEQSPAAEISSEYDISAEQSRFQQQLSGNWNEQILANNDKLEPLAEVMNQLAVLEEEKNAADKRIQQEFKMREENEEKFYLEKRKLLEDTAAQIQASAYTKNSDAVKAKVENDTKTL